MQLTDNDSVVSRLVVRFDARAEAVRAGVEEGGAYRLGVRLNETPGQTLTIPLTYTYLGGATAADFTNLPANVTFGTNATSSGVTIRPVDDFDDDPGEGIRVSFGTLPAGVSVGASGRSTSIPVIDDDALPGLSVADANAREWPNPLPCLIFVVTMDRMDVDHEVRVDYATRNGTAVAGQDFTPISGTLVVPGERESAGRTTSKRLCVRVLDDSHDEGIEEMTLVLSNPVRAYLADGTATGVYQQLRSDAAGDDGALRAHGGTARGRAGGATTRGAARAGLPWPVQGPGPGGAATRKGARKGARFTPPARCLGP